MRYDQRITLISQHETAYDPAAGARSSPQIWEFERSANVSGMGEEFQMRVYGRVFSEALIIRLLGRFAPQVHAIRVLGREYVNVRRKLHRRETVFYVAGGGHGETDD